MNDTVKERTEMIALKEINVKAAAINDGR